MRTDTAGFAQKNLALDKKPRFTIEVAFDFASTDLLYLTSHMDCEVPTGATVLYGLVETLSVVSQSLDPIKANSTIGQIAFSATDSLSALTAAINSRYPTTSLRGKRVRVYVGYEGLPWSDYILVQTQIVDKLTFTPSSVYEFSCSDVQRTARKDIFKVKTTNLYETVDGAQTAIRVHDTTELIPVAHGTGYTDGSASLTVGYIKLEDEKVLWKEKVETAINATGTDITVAAAGSTITSTSTDLSVFADGMQIVLSGTASDDGAHYVVGTPTATSITTSSTFTGAASGTSYSVTAYPQLYQCTRGWFNTKAVKHEVDPDTVDSENKPEVKEYVYLEMPAIQMLYAVLTGTIYGEGSTLPDHWNLAIDASTFIDTGSFTGIGADLWDTTDSTLGFPARLGGQEKIDGKKFYEQQLCRLTGTFLRVRADGTLSLKRMTNVLNDSAFVVTLTDDHITDLGNLVHDMTSVYNQFQIDWNWDDVKKKYTRGEQIVDQTSISAHGAAAVLTDQYKTLHGSSHTKVALYSQFDSGRDRYAGPPYRTNVGVQHRFNALEVGEIVRLKTTKVRNCVTGGTADLSMEIQKITVDWLDGIKLELFGSSQKADPKSQSSLNQVLSDTFYTATGTDLASYGGITKTDVAGTLTITAGTLAGNADMTNAAAIYYYDGDITIPYGDTLYITQNVQLRCTGTITVNGRIDGVGAGLTGGAYGVDADGQAGLGTAQAGGGWSGIYAGDAYNPEVTHGYYTEIPGIVTGADALSAVPYAALANGSTTLTGLPTDLRGTSGGPGRWLHFTPDIYTTYTSDGGDGGNGGAGLLVICRGAVAGANAELDLSGDDGTEGGAQITEFLTTWAPGSGAGGAPGALLLLLDGYLSVDTWDSKFIANVGLTPVRGTSRHQWQNYVSASDLTYSYYTHGQDHDPNRGTISRAQSMFRAQYIPANLTPEADAPEEAPVAASISISESAGTKNSINIVGLNISAVPPSSGAYRGSMIYISLQGVDAWTQVGEARLTANVVAWVPADNSTYTIRAFPVSIDGLESLDYIESSHTVASTQVSVIPTGNSLATSATVGAGTSGEGVKVTSAGISGHDTGGVAKFLLDAATGILTATSAVISGAITATSGVIGGWTIAANSISKGNVTLDAANTRIQAGPNAGDYVRIDTNGITGVDSVLGTTFNLPTDGSAPTFSSGIINSTVFNITSAGILETSATAGDGTASGAGVRINDLGIKGWAANNATPNFFLDATDGTITAVDANISGTVTIGGGSGIANLSDAGALATASSADWSTQVSGTGKPADNADVTGDNQSVGSGLLYNWNLDVADSEGKPAGLRGVEGITDRTGVKFGDGTKSFLRLEHPTDNAIAYGFPAIPIDDKQVYRVTVRHKSSAATASGLYLRMNELASDLPQGKTHIGTSGESVTEVRTSLVDMVGNGPMPGTSWVDVTYTYTPTAGTLFASFSMYKYFTGVTHTYDVDAVMFTPIAKTADEIAESATKKWAGESGADVTSANTAAAIAGQGSLATASSADWGTQVAGTGKPADNADVTQSALITGTTITGGGITLSSGGNIKGGQTAYATGTGFFLGYESAAYKFSIGSSTSFMKWTGSSFEVQTGDTTVKGITINPGGDNELHFYGDRGDTTVEELATIGISTVGSDSVIGHFGSSNTTDARIAGLFETGGGLVLRVISGSANAAGDALYVSNAQPGSSATAGKFENSGAGKAIQGTGNSGPGISASSVSDFGGVFAGNNADGGIKVTNGVRIVEQSANPSTMGNGTDCQMYMKADKLIIAYKDAGGTQRYKYLNLGTNTSGAWTYTTTAP